MAREAVNRAFHQRVDRPGLRHPPTPPCPTIAGSGPGSQHLAEPPGSPPKPPDRPCRRLSMTTRTVRAAGLETLKTRNAGHPGGLSTLHADSAREAVSRLEDLLCEVTARPGASSPRRST